MPSTIRGGMPDGRRKRCKECRQHTDDVGPISWDGFCGPCGVARATRAAVEMHEHRGEFFRRWRRGMAASVGLTIVDDDRSGA